jgi:hypothetical protein
MSKATLLVQPINHPDAALVLLWIPFRRGLPPFRECPLPLKEPNEATVAEGKGVAGNFGCGVLETILPYSK